MRLRCTCRATVERDFAAEFVVEGRGCRGCRARPGARQERGRRSDGTRRRLLPPSLSSVLVLLGPFPYRTRPKPNPDQTRNRVPWGKNPCGVCVAQRSVATTRSRQCRSPLPRSTPTRWPPPHPPTARSACVLGSAAAASIRRQPRALGFSAETIEGSRTTRNRPYPVRAQVLKTEEGRALAACASCGCVWAEHQSCCQQEECEELTS